jgi:signal transduction histidine kinase
VSPSAIDDPVELSQLIDDQSLGEIAQSFAELHGVGVAICRPDGTPVAFEGRTASAADGASYHREPLAHNGDPMALIVVGPYRSADAEGDWPVVDGAHAARIGRHICQVLEVVVHSSWTRHLATTTHAEAMQEAFTELQERDQRLVAAAERVTGVDRVKSDFLATVSHELRTPLTSVIGYSEMLIEGLAGALSGEQKEYVETILSKADQLLQLITGILDISMIQTRSLEMAREPIALLEVIEAVAATVSAEAERCRVSIVLPTRPVPQAFGDKRKVRQVLLHLVANAIKFSVEGGDIEVTIEIGPLSPHDHAMWAREATNEPLSRRYGLRVLVRDSGIGIAPEQQARVFEPFFQVDSSSTRSFGGTGLGLSLAKSYVEAHGGHIWVESVLGAGSTFTVSLPAVPEELESYLAEQLKQANL